MKGLRDYLSDGYEVKSSHNDTMGRHWLVLQNGPSVVMIHLPFSSWTGKPDTSGKSEECWEIHP